MEWKYQVQESPGQGLCLRGQGFEIEKNVLFEGFVTNGWRSVYPSGSPQKTFVILCNLDGRCGKLFCDNRMKYER